MLLVNFLAQSSSYEPPYTTVLPCFGYIFALVALLLVMASWWNVFEKAGHYGIQSLIPILNYIVILRIAGKPWYWILLLFIPFINLITLFVVFIDFAKAFDRSALFGVGLFLLSPIFIFILAFGEDEYVGVNSIDNWSREMH